jgi:hypothetical protein
MISDPGMIKKGFVTRQFQTNTKAQTLHAIHSLHTVDVKYNEHPKLAGHHWTDIIIRQHDISRLSFNDNVHHGRPVPGQI